MTKRIFIDIEKCYNCKECKAKCSYYYKHSRVFKDSEKEESQNKGFEKFFSKVLQYYICRRCEDAFCINACPNEALFKDKDGILHRSLFRCTSCKSCLVACPFGTIYKDVLEYKSSQCDFCLTRADDKNPPLCVVTCPEGAIQYVEIDPDEKQDIYEINKNLVAKVKKWILEPVQ
jgi:Fe-S-cluster-containing dehydrogenase component